MTRLAHRNLAPDLMFEEGGQRFSHRDLESPDQNVNAVWAEAEQIQQRLSWLIFQKQRGELIAVIDSRCVNEADWYPERLSRLRAILRKRAA
jgi:hypothetical protein